MACMFHLSHTCYIGLTYQSHPLWFGHSQLLLLYCLCRMNSAHSTAKCCYLVHTGNTFPWEKSAGEWRRSLNSISIQNGIYMIQALPSLPLYTYQVIFVFLWVLCIPFISYVTRMLSLLLRSCQPVGSRRGCCGRNCRAPDYGGFWRQYITLGIIGVLNSVHRPAF